MKKLNLVVEMSHHRLSRFASKENISDLLKDIGSEVNFSARHSQLLSEYRSISYGEEAALERAAAIEAFHIIEKNFEGLTMNELGVQLPAQEEQVYNRSFSDQETGKERQYIEDTIKANIEFLELWDQLRASKKQVWEEMSQSTEFYQQQVVQVINANPQYLTMPGVIASAIESAGYRPDQTLSFNAAEFAEKGIKFSARSDEGDVLDVKLTSSGVYTHIEDANKNNRACQRKSNALAKKIQAELRAQLGIMGGFGSESEGSGFGELNLDNPKPALPEEETSEQYIPPAPETLNL